MKNMEHKQSIADPCVYFSRNRNGELVIWLSWVDDNLIGGLLQVVKDEGKKLAKEIKIEDIGELKEFIGCKIEIDKLEQSAKFTQLVTIQLFWTNLVQEKRGEYTNKAEHSSEETGIWQNFGKQGPI